DLSHPGETNLLQCRQMFFYGHKMICPIMGRQRRVDLIANQKASVANQQVIKLSIKFGNVARVTELMHSLQRNDKIKLGRQHLAPTLLFEILLDKIRLTFEWR